MNINQLEYFRELYIKGSFLSASETLGITQPALSLQIQKLEDELGYKLLDRNRRPIRLTIEGERFYEKAVEILRLVDELKEVSLQISEEIRGTLKVGIIPTLAP
ncbi:MAG: LysR family transcriptional regulator [Prolixibacteraceae bacterium]|nr:LysR family transcriptional regulator [Prolixibacteraceae bacterium]